MKPISFDFDGVIHSYTSGWKGYETIPDPPVKGIEAVLEKLYKKGFSIQVYSSRAGTPQGIRAIRNWLAKYHMLKYIDVITCIKNPSIVTIDDRCICFDGNTEGLVEKIENFKTYMEV